VRLFTGVREPAAAYDAVVIGAGVGGLICANLLARSGLRVLLVEQHYLVGGYCSTFRRRGYTFDAATHFYPLLGNRSTITGRLLEEIGVTTRWVQMDPVDTFHLPDGTSFAVPADFDTYLARLKAEFPAEAAALDRFFASVREVYLLGVREYFRGQATAKLGPYAPLSLRDVLERTFQDRRLKLLLTADCPHWGSPPSRVSFVFDSMLRLSYFLGNYYPRGGSQAFVDELARRFEERGGHILLMSMVRRILVANGRAGGVDVETGPGRDRRRVRVRADVVVSNADLRLTVDELIGAPLLDPAYVAKVRALRPTYPCFLTHLGLKDVPIESLRAVHGYHWTGWDPEEVGRTALKFKVFVPTLYEPHMSPPGGQVLIVQKVLAGDYQAVRDWTAHKAGIEAWVMARLERLVPGLQRNVVVQMSASAFTSYRYTLNHHGAMLGWEMAPDQLGEQRVGVATPIPNLYLVGHWTQPGGGITPVIVSAMRAAQAIVARSPDQDAGLAEAAAPDAPALAGAP
jgi:phytoene dehydrogenase-like protein